MTEQQGGEKPKQPDMAEIQRMLQAQMAQAQEAAAEAARPPVNSSLAARAKSAAVLGPLVLIILYFGGFPFMLLMAALGGIGAFEWARMVLKGQPNPKTLARVTGVATAAGVIVSGMPQVSMALLLVMFLSLAFLVFAVCYAERRPNTGLLLFGIVYIGFSVGAMTVIRDGDTTQGLYHTATLLLMVWASDIAAYFTGRTLGGPKLAPNISPKKTWSGFVGSSLGAGAAAAALATPAVTGWLGVWTLGDMGPQGYFVMGFVLGMVGQAGDLFISYFKRRFKVKDTGALIPGHGGVLDRIDALMLVALAFALLLIPFSRVG